MDPKFHIYHGFDDYGYDVKFLDSNDSFNGTLQGFDFLPPALSVPLSVGSMDLWSPHKMAEIRPRHSSEGVPDPRMRVPGSGCHVPCHAHSVAFSRTNHAEAVVCACKVCPITGETVAICTNLPGLDPGGPGQGLLPLKP